MEDSLCCENVMEYHVSEASSVNVSNMSSSVPH